jgi:hypothetical protein
MLMLLSLLTSALMLGMKLASVEIVRLEQQEMSRMEAERDTMLRELQEELKAREGEKVFTAAAHSDSAECRACVAAANPAATVPSQSSQQTLRSGIDKRGTQSRTVVLEMTTFEIGMMPECGR